MKKLFSLAVVLIAAVAAMAQEPVITFDKLTHDFGTFNEAEGRVSTVFTFTNEGMSPLVLTNVRASCGCTTPKWPREPIEPGMTGQITVTYNANGRPGHFTKTITVTSNATETTKKLTIKGEVIPKSAKPVDMYPVKMGSLSLKQQIANFGTINKGTNKTVIIEYANKTNEAITLDYLGESSDLLFVNLSMTTLEPNQTGQIQIALNHDCDFYGPFSLKLYMIVNGKREITDAFAVTVQGDVTEDFSVLTTDQLKQAPIADIQQTIDLGTLAAGKKVKKSITVRNLGTNPLIVRRVVSTNAAVTAIQPKAIKSGRKGDIKIEVNTTGMKPTTYKRELSVITNDPKHPIHKVIVVWTIQ